MQVEPYTKNRAPPKLPVANWARMARSWGTAAPRCAPFDARLGPFRARYCFFGANVRKSAETKKWLYLGLDGPNRDSVYFGCFACFKGGSGAQAGVKEGGRLADYIFVYLNKNDGFAGYTHMVVPENFRLKKLPAFHGRLQSSDTRGLMCVGLPRATLSSAHTQLSGAVPINDLCFLASQMQALKWYQLQQVLPELVLTSHQPEAWKPPRPECCVPWTKPKMVQVAVRMQMNCSACVDLSSQVMGKDWSHD